MAEDKHEQHQACMERFIELANTMKDEGIGVDVVSWSLMSASAVHASYTVAGNEGGLTASGIDKIAEAYKQNLAQLQALKQRQQ
ncbi:hypothetical protein [Pseudohaliea rubra]|uniref:DUF3144 domain-containing protein n=1 Tax=Pseudohaliea rubra DSM 19751 TaxID=1265313 RepID=A0A095VQE9_9GAMM|nr:hypothetical protein [Pseudohaliea rubra]KGE03662.1 hypothetical protein HRUBRA_01753 [Pseudohaliea rubra DSM 19751]